VWAFMPDNLSMAFMEKYCILLLRLVG